MQFVLYTEKTPAQALTAINARMQAKESSARASLGGWVEKNGAFALSVSTPVIGRFQRRTVMRGLIERDAGLTVVRGDVPGGVDRQGQIVVYIALALLAVLILTSGNAVPALIVIPLGAYLYIPMTGDRANSETLMGELQRTLKAKATPPKKTDSSTARASRPTTARTGASRPTSTRTTGSRPTSSRSTSSTGTAKPKSSGTARKTGTTSTT